MSTDDRADHPTPERHGPVDADRADDAVGGASPTSGDDAPPVTDPPATVGSSAPAGARTPRDRAGALVSGHPVASALTLAVVAGLLGLGGGYALGATSPGDTTAVQRHAGPGRGDRDVPERRDEDRGDRPGQDRGDRPGQDRGDRTDEDRTDEDRDGTSTPSTSTPGTSTGTGTGTGAGTTVPAA